MRFQEGILAEELRNKLSNLKKMKTQLKEINHEISEKLPTFWYICVRRLVATIRKREYDQLIKKHTKKISCLLAKQLDVDEHLHNISSYELSFFQELIICRGLKFSLPQKVPARDIQASFEKAYWKLEPLLSDSTRELASASLRSTALNYIEKKPTAPPKALIRALTELKKKDDIVVTKPDKGDGVVIMDKSDYTRLLREASINDDSKFIACSEERQKTRGRRPTHYHPLLAKEKLLTSIVHKILPKQMADSLSPKGSRLANLYGLPKTHKPVLSMCSILSATGTYNFKLAKWLDKKLKPLATNAHTVDDIFLFAEEIQNKVVNEGDVLVSYDVTALFTNIPVDEAIQILANKAFKNNWFNNTYNLQLRKADLIELLSVSVKNQLFQFDRKLFEQIDGVAMGSPLGPLLANVFMCSLEEQLQEEGTIPTFYKCYSTSMIP